MWHTALTTILLISQVSAGLISDAVKLGRRETAEDSLKRYVDRIVEPIERRQAAPTLNTTQWDANTMAACITALEGLKGVATNPSGLAVCYNLPTLDDMTGAFQADLRLFKISEPTGDFASISSENVEVGLSYVGATVRVASMNSSTIGRRDDESLISWPRSEKRQSVEPIMAQAYSFSGQINADLMKANMGTADLQKVLVPTVTLTGTDSTGKKVNTTLSSQEATFVSGVFSVVTTPTESQNEPPIQTLVVTGDQPFVVPGLNILIFPIGAIITGIWAILFVSTIAYGTYGRMQFRDNYRRRAARADKGGLATI